MAITQALLFSWDAVEACSDLGRFFLVRDHLPDEAIIQALEAQRGQGRDDFPVRAMFNAVLAGIVFQHPSIESLIRELSRNPSHKQALMPPSRDHPWRWIAHRIPAVRASPHAQHVQIRSRRICPESMLQ